MNTFEPTSNASLSVRAESNEFQTYRSETHLAIEC